MRTDIESFSFLSDKIKHQRTIFLVHSLEYLYHKRESGLIPALRVAAIKKELERRFYLDIVIL